MMGPTKLSTIRADLRKACNMSDAELQEWFSRQFESRSQSAGTGEVELATLQLFRDALARETRRKARSRKLPTTRGRTKAQT
jgi:hypothetical protein